MRVAYLSSTFLNYDRCGTGIWAAAFLPNLAALGVEIHVVTTDIPEIVERCDGLHIHKALKSWQPDELPRLFRCLEKIRPDILHLNHPTRIAAGRDKLLVNLLPFWNRFSARYPLITTMHEFSTVSLLGRLKQWAIYAMSDIVTVTNAQNQSDLRAWPGVRLEAAEVVEVGAPVSPALLAEPLTPRGQLRQRWGLSEDDLVVGFAGFFTHPKGFHHLIEVVAPLMKGDPRVKVLALSSWNFSTPAYKELLTSRIEALGLTDRFIVTGFLDDRDLWHALGAVDVCSFPCEFPVERRSSATLRLAVLRGIPVQTFAASRDYAEFGCRHGQNIWLSLYPDLEEYRQDLAALLADPALRGRISQGTLSTHPYLRQDEIAKSVLNLYQRLLSERGRRSPPGMRIIPA